MSTTKVPHEISELSRFKAVDFYRLQKHFVPPEIEPGQIWSTHSSFQLPDGQQYQTDQPKIVVILMGTGSITENMNPITVAPLSINITMASESDIVIKQESSFSPLTFDCMVEIWNESPALKGQLNKFICSLTKEATEILHQVYSSRLIDSTIPYELRKYIGSKIMAEDDPRLGFQEEEILAINYLAKAATASLEMNKQEKGFEAAEAANWFTFEIKPFWGKLSNFLSSLKPLPSFAYAANSTDSEIERCLIMQPEKKERFIFELLNSRRMPFSIYLKAYEITPSLIGRNCFISIKTKEHVYRSEIIILNQGINIEVGKDPQFRCEYVESVEIALALE